MGKKNKKEVKARRNNVFWKTVWMSGLVSGINIFLHMIIFSIFFERKYYLSSYAMVILVSYVFAGVLVGVFIYGLLKIKKIRNVNKNVLISFGLLLSLLLGMLGIPPFGTWELTGDLGFPSPTPLIILVFFPLVSFLWVLDKIGMDLSINENLWKILILISFAGGYCYLLARGLSLLHKRYAREIKR